MLQLNVAQVQALQAIILQRDVQRMGDALALAFPAVVTRLGERFAALIQHGVQRAAALELTHGLCVARYLACWFVLGAEFESKPGFAWAQMILGDARRAQGAKVFQLCRRTRETLNQANSQAAPASGQIGGADFDTALALLDQGLMDSGTLGALSPGGRIQLGEACDIDALDLALVLSPGTAAWRLRYTASQGQWQRLPCAPEPARITLNASQVSSAVPASTLPAQITVLSHPVGQQAAQLKLRLRAGSCCDTQTHPLVSLNSPQGLSDWRGLQTRDILFSLPAQPEAAASGLSLLPAIAVEVSPQLNLLSLSSCGLRDAGQSFGDLSTQLAVYPAEQHLLAWRRTSSAALSWPEPTAGQASPPAARCRLERDGLPLDSSRWQAGLEDLDRQLAEGLAKLLTAW
ncbi:hypothetical protein ACVBEH_19255, partial [Roseateles sp. GG27B]